VGSRLVDVVKGTEGDNTALVVNGRISAVGREGEIAIPSEAKVVDAHSKWLIPGLMDMHVHISQSSPLARLYLANGVKAVRDTGGDVTPLRLSNQDTQSGKTNRPASLFHRSNP
jgi:imidazolonepropionase-like amidohydrolase